MKKILFILFIMLNVSLTAQVVFVPLSHPIYNYLERLEVKGIVKDLVISTKPISRKYVGEILRGIDKDKLTSVEFNEYEKYTSEFSETHNEKGHIFKYNYKYAVMYFDPIFQFDYDINKSNDDNEDENGKRLKGGAKVYGYFADKIGYYFEGANNYEKNNVRELKNWDNQEQGIGELDQGKYYSQVTAYASLSTKYIDFIFGRFSNYWGDGETGTLPLSNKAPSYNQFMIKADYFDKIKLTYFHASLFSDELDSTRLYFIKWNAGADSFPRRFYKNKYLAAHRLEIIAFDNFSIAFNELAYYGERDFDWSYLNPIMFYWAAKNYTKDTDNLQIGMDCKWRPLNKVKLYGGFLIDELKIKNIFDKNHHHNHIAGQIGLYLVEPFTKNLDFRIEYTALMPWIYTHKVPVNRATNIDYVMGYWTGQNADNLYFCADYRISPFLKTKIAFSRYRKGGLIDVWNQYNDEVAENFLNGYQYKRYRTSLLVDYNIWKKLSISVKYQYTDLDLNEDNYNDKIYLDTRYYENDFYKHKICCSIKYNL